MTWIRIVTLLLCIAGAGARAAGCSAEERPVRLVELYTSEGCNSCPPADRWLSSLKNEPDVVALAFHVDYWDRLGWVDRFASPAFTRRQAEQRRVNGARFSYTPQVVIDGVDGRRPLPAARDGGIGLSLAREGDRYIATVRVASSRPLAAFWAVTEDGHRTAVKAGENEGVTLQHDAVVREYVTVAAWTEPTMTLAFRPSTPADAAHPRAVILVVVDAATGKPVQARRLACEPGR